MPNLSTIDNELIQKRLAMMTMAWAALVAFVFAVRAIFSDIPERYVPLFLVAAVCSLNAYYLKHGGQTQRTSLITISAISVGIFFAVYSNGGIQSVAATWVLVIPFLAGLMGGISFALYGVILAFTCLASFLLIDLYWGATPDLTPVHQQYQQDRLHQFGQLITICICFSYFLLKVKTHYQALRHQIKQTRMAEKAATDANAAKSQFLANMSHEIRTPLNGVISTFSLIQKKPLSEEQKRLIEIANISSNSLLSLINDVLDISKMEAGKLTLEPEIINIADLICDMDTLYQYRCEEKGLTFYCNSVETPIWVDADAVRIRQIIENLLSNALKFTHKGSIRLDVDYDELENHYIKLKICVSDTGIGMSEKQQACIFESFTQADGSTTRLYGGTGLGLTICNQLIVLMNGSLTLESMPKQGSRFCVSLPLKRATPINHQNDAKPLDTEQTSKQSLNRKRTLLLVEDNDINMEIIKSLLKDYEFHLMEARNGQQALETLHSEVNIDGILMDCQMPIMDGYETTKSIRAIQKFTSTPIIAMTANAMEGDREKCIAAGMDAYISKPIDPQILESELKRFNLLH